ncbi:MAG: hypothetical protein WAP03_13615 [Methylorubrum rhodinum]|uniref:hypothetical protein n=1 Tax=Methylorubrum rhodinum TaxID=29428 RepID=UPI003BAFB354
MRASDLDLLERPEAWPPFDDAGEVFIGRALQEVANMAMELMIIRPDLLEEPFRRLLDGLQDGRLVARAGGEPIPAKNWYGPLGLAMLLSCSTNAAELDRGELDSGPRKRWIAVTRASLDAFKGGAVVERPLATRERNTLLRIVLGLAKEKFHYSPDGGRNSAARNISDALGRQGIRVSEDTILKYLREAVEAGLDES